MDGISRRIFQGKQGGVAEKEALMRSVIARLEDTREKGEGISMG